MHCFVVIDTIGLSTTFLHSNINLSNFTFANPHQNLINDKMKQSALFLYETLFVRERNFEFCHDRNFLWRSPVDDIIAFYPNVTTYTFGSFAMANPSVVCRLSVTLAHPTQRVEHFSNISSPLCTLAIFWHPCKILRRSFQKNPSVGGVKRKRGIKIERWWTYRRLYLMNGTR